MYFADCEWYVDMGEHNKPLCEKRSLRPAKCSECPVYIRSIEEDNTKLRDLVTKAHACKTDEGCCEGCYQNEGCCPIEREMQELGIEVTA